MPGHSFGRNGLGPFSCRSILLSFAHEGSKTRQTLAARAAGIVAPMPTWAFLAEGLAGVPPGVSGKYDRVKEDETWSIVVIPTMTERLFAAAW